ncbi:MAG: hypothetical protein WCL32_15305 [Planctomycetota bacterium]
MEILASLYRTYNEIVGGAGGGRDRDCERKLGVWLKDDVLPELHKLSRRLKFREQARWPLDNLLAGSGSIERKRIEEVDDLIVATARNLKKILHSPRFDERVGDRFLAKRPGDEKVRIDGINPIEVVERQIVTYCKARELRGRIDFVASRFWSDLVTGQDYFEPTGGWPTKDRQGIFRGSFAPWFTPEVHSGGDFISRCVILRLESVLRDFQEAIPLTEAIFPELHPKGKSETKKWRTFIDGFVAVRDRTTQLRHFLLENEQQPLRNACILLTQVGAASSKQFDLSWLGKYHRLAFAPMWHRLQTHSKDLFERIARALLAVGDFYAQQPPETTELDEAIARNGLVIRAKAKVAIWKRRNLDLPPGSKEFTLLRLLAKKGIHGQSVGDDEVELYEEPPGDSAMATLFGRLKKKLPPDLWSLIVTGDKNRSYKLTLEPSKIVVLD